MPFQVCPFAGGAIPEFNLTGPRSHGQDKPTADFGSPAQQQVVIRVKMRRSLRGTLSEGGAKHEQENSPRCTCSPSFQVAIKLRWFVTESFKSPESSALRHVASPFRIRAPCDTLPGSCERCPRAGPCHAHWSPAEDAPSL